MRKVTAIVIAAMAVVATLAAVSIDRSEAAAALGLAAPQIAPVAPAPSEAPGNAPVLTEQGAPAAYGDGQAGIWVSGEGTISVAPDLAMLDFGVEVSAPNVSEANSRASTAMDAVVGALKARRVKDEDIQTSRFSVYPRYDYIEEEKDGIRSSREVLVGYRVRNNATVKLRDLDAVGEVIDEVVAAGGDDVRINNINFTLEDSKPKMAELREMAVADAKAKAEHLAQLSDVTVGRLIYISEGASAPSVRGFAERSFDYAYAAPAALAAPSISGGELRLSLRVQAGFAIY